MAHWCQVPPCILWVPVHRRDAQMWTQRTPCMESRNNREPTVPHAPEQGRPSTRTTRARVSLVGGNGCQGSKPRWTGPRLPCVDGLPAWAPVPAPSPPPESLSLSRLSRCRMDGVARQAAQDHRPGEAAWDLRVHQHPLNLFLHLHCFLFGREQAKLGF